MTLLHANVTFLMEDELSVKAERYVIKQKIFLSNGMNRLMSKMAYIKLMIHHTF